MTTDHFALIDAAGKTVRQIPIPADKAKGMARTTFERECRARYGVDDVNLYLRDSALGAPHRKD